MERIHWRGSCLNSKKKAMEGFGTTKKKKKKSHGVLLSLGFEEESKISMNCQTDGEDFLLGKLSGFQ